VVTPVPLGTDPATPTTVIGVPITLTANTTDTLEGADPTYQWSSSCAGTLEPPLPGSAVIPDTFSMPSGPAPLGTGDITTTFTSYCNGIETITFWIQDDTPMSGSIRAKVSFTVTYVPQGAEVTIAFDQYPDITAIGIAPPGDVPIYGEAVGLVAAVQAYNTYGLTYAWTDECTGAEPHGVFTDADTLTPTWLAPPGGVMPAVCKLTLTIQELPPGNGQNTASLTLDITNGTISVMFYDLDVTVVGLGAVASVPAGVDCPADTSCTASFGKGYDVALTATAGTPTDPGTRIDFSGWSGACSGTTAACSLTMDSAKSVQATFTAFHQLTVQLPVYPAASFCCTNTEQCIYLPPFGQICVPGVPSCSICYSYPAMSVQSSPAGIDCATAQGSIAGLCSAWFPAGTIVSLTNGASAGCDAGAPDCTVTMDQPRTVTY
jgi:hypothetical protein